MLIRGETLVEGVLEHCKPPVIPGIVLMTNHRKNDNPWQVQLLNDRLGDGGFARTGASRDGDDTDVGPRRRVVSSLLDGDMALGA